MTIFDWDNHYKLGGNSGDPESYKLSRDWKHNLLNKYYNNGDSIIDVGCGDLQFWYGCPPPNYTGMDISQTITNKHTINFPNNKFICSNASINVNTKSNIVICFDMLWHIIDDSEYINILKNIKSYSNKYIYIYTWCDNPFKLNIIDSIKIHIINLLHGKKTYDNTGDGEYQKYRDFSLYSKQIFEPEFKLIEIHKNNIWKFGAMYIYQKI